MLRIQATADIPEGCAESLRDTVGHEHFTDATSKRLLLSTDPPSFIELAGALASWKTVFAASSTVFFSTMSKRLADDLYDHRKVIAASVFNPVRRIAAAVRKALDDTPQNSYFRVQITSIDGSPSATLRLKSEDMEEIAFKLACLYAVADQCLERLSEYATQYDGRVTPPLVEVSRAGEVTVRCYGGLANDPIEIAIQLFEA